MTPDTANTEEHIESNPVDYIIGLLKSEDDAAVRIHIEPLNAAEIAVLLESLPPELRHRLWALLPLGIEGETLAYLGEEVQGSIIGEMEHADVVAVTETMDPI